MGRDGWLDWEHSFGVGTCVLLFASSALVGGK